MEPSGPPAVFLQLLGQDEVYAALQNGPFRAMKSDHNISKYNSNIVSKSSIQNKRNVSYISQSQFDQRKAQFFSIQLLSVISTNFAFSSDTNTNSTSTINHTTNSTFYLPDPFVPNTSKLSSLFFWSITAMNCSLAQISTSKFEASSAVILNAYLTPETSKISPYNLCQPLPPNASETTEEVYIHSWSLVFSPLVSAIIAFVVLLCSILTFGGNLLVFIAFFIEKKLQLTNNYFILSLAVADGFVGLISVNFWLVLYLSNAYWPFGWAACVTWIFCDYVWCTTSIYHVFIISIDRYWSVSKPANYRCKMNPRMAFIMIIPTWLVSIVWWLALIVGHPIVVGNLVIEGMCYANYWGIGLWTYLSTSITYWIPLVVITTLYIHIYRIAKKMKKKRRLKSEMLRKQLVTAAKATSAIQKLRKANQESSSAASPGSNMPSKPEIHGSPVPVEDLKDKETDANKRKQGTQPEHAVDSEPQSAIVSLSRRIAAETHLQKQGSTTTDDSGNTPVDKNKLSFPMTDFKKMRQNSARESDNSTGDNENNNNNNSNINNTPNILPKAIKIKAALAFQARHPNTDGIEYIGNNEAGSTKESGQKLSALSRKKVENVIKVLKTPPAVKRLVKKQSNDKKAMRTLTFLLGAFILCWTPWNIAEVVNGIWGADTVNAHLYQFTWFLTYFNSALNPLCYAFANTLFKDTFIRILSCGKVRPKQSGIAAAHNANAARRAVRK